ncbi:uncharacterized protein LOC111088807 isoform X2 [Limulus polyphemus]|uniref:Uncharacterized protein LOC111088807 isoform X2 n=1 Tax=Limulus polyphemus TaxID=6850 RepID=A0ABM1TI47_LIMPO|nr:uncharacterized protein LOC111088807 isoform X2 [Limulus polyphemus]
MTKDYSEAMELPHTETRQFPPRRRSIPNGFDFDLEEVWWPKTQRKNSRGMTDKKTYDLDRTVPTEYYSRHRMLPTTSLPDVTITKKQRKKSKGSLNLNQKSEAANNGAHSNSSGRNFKPESMPCRAHDGSAIYSSNQLEGKRNDSSYSLTSEEFDF